jgi:chromate reductase
MRVLTISGSLRPASLNTLLLRAAEEQAPAGVQIDRFTTLAEIPPFHGDRAEAGAVPPAVQDLRDRIAAADAVLIATPEYNGSIPGVLKNALDWTSVPFPDNALRGKPVAVIGASTGAYGGMWAQAELRKVLGIIGARVINADMSLGKAHEHFGDDGTLPDLHAGRLTNVIDALLAEVHPIAA